MIYSNLTIGDEMVLCRIALCFAVVIATSCLASKCSADFLIKIGNGDGDATPWASFNANEINVVSIPVFMKMDAPITDFQMAFNFGNDSPGFGMPVGFSNPVANFTMSDPASPFRLTGINTEFPKELDEFPLFKGNVNWDFSVTGDSATEIAFAELTHVFDLEFKVSPEVELGTYLVSGVVNPTGSAGFTSFSNVGSPVGGVVTFTSGSVAAVPEPGSMALLGLMAAGGAAYRRFRKKAPKANELDAA